MSKHDQHRCPRCYFLLKRIRRRTIDRLLSRFIPLGRFRCSACEWSGLRRL